jgi:hypothetical protein
MLSQKLSTAFTLGGRKHDALVGVYAEMVRAYVMLRRPLTATEPHGEVQLRIIDHLLDRLGQARAGGIATPITDIVDRLHAEVTSGLPVG